MAGLTRRWLAALVIVSAASGCDNVEWGGVEVRLRPPPPASGDTVGDSLRMVGETGVALPAGPVLYMARRDSTGTVMVPVGEVFEGGVAPFPDEESAPGYRSEFAREFLSPGREFVLFAAGARVGRFTVTSVDNDPSFCTPRPAARGVVELVPQAVEASRFLALPADSATRSLGFDTYAPLEHDRGHRIAGLNLAGELIPQVQARWPTSMVDARADMQAFRLQEGGPAISATFLFRDRMAVEPTVSSAYSLFLMATPEEGEYRPAYVWYREAGRDGKGAMRYFDHLDWDRDGRTEVLLEVLGERSRWVAALGHRDGEWQRIYEDPCGAEVPPAEDTGG